MTWQITAIHIDELTQEKVYDVATNCVTEGMMKVRVLLGGAVEIDTFNCVGIRVNDLTEFIGMLVAVFSKEER